MLIIIANSVPVASKSDCLHLANCSGWIPFSSCNATLSSSVFMLEASVSIVFSLISAWSYALINSAVLISNPLFVVVWVHQLLYSWRAFSFCLTFLPDFGSKRLQWNNFATGFISALFVAPERGRTALEISALCKNLVWEKTCSDNSLSGARASKLQTTLSSVFQFYIIFQTLLESGFWQMVCLVPRCFSHFSSPGMFSQLSGDVFAALQGCLCDSLGMSSAWGLSSGVALARGAARRGRLALARVKNPAPPLMWRWLPRFWVPGG